VDDDGREGLQSSLDLTEPDQLQVAYTRALFASFLFRHPQERVLIVGLGGGGMVRFIDLRLPDTRVEVVEIDPVVVALADQYFGTGPTPRVTIHTEDAFLFFGRNTSQYDVIYMDAFLKPSVDAKADSETARLKTVSFLKTIKGQLVPGGVLACNLIAHRKETKADLAALRAVFPCVKTMKVSGTGNLAVFATGHEIEKSRKEWITLGESLEESLPIGIPFSNYAELLK
jgi:spermidine synthase